MGSIRQGLRCSLNQVSLDQNFHYEALSYVQDSQTRDVEIDCDGKSLFVTENCATALQALQHHVRHR